MSNRQKIALSSITWNHKNYSFFPSSLTAFFRVPFFTPPCTTRVTTTTCGRKNGVSCHLQAETGKPCTGSCSSSSQSVQAKSCVYVSLCVCVCVCVCVCICDVCVCLAVYNMNLLPPTTANEFSAACDEPNPPPAGSELGAPLVEFLPLLSLALF